MPNYTFKCPSCGKEFVDLVKMDQKATKCECGKDAEKIWSTGSVSFDLKGKGWYKDGYSKKGK